MINPTKLLTFIILATSASQSISADKETLEERIKSINPNMEVTNVQPSSVEGISEVEINGKEYVYATEDARHIFTGNLINLGEGGFTNVTEQRLEILRKSQISEIDLSSTITFEAEEEHHELYVFTDVTCGYCVKFHEHINDINDLGVTVHYLAFPRAGMSSPSADMMRKVWCSPNRRDALTEAKVEKKVSQSPLPCNSPVSSHYTLAYRLGVSGTPAIYDENGRHLGGYLTTEEIDKALNR